MEKEKRMSEELVSLNDSLSDELYINELEQRLETDPLLVGGLVSFLQADGDIMPLGCIEGYTTCPEGYVTCDKGYS